MKTRRQVIAVYVGDRLRRIRQERCLSRSDLSWKVRIPTSNIGRVEDGKHLPDVSTIDRLARALGVTVAFVFEGLPKERGS